jgi:hypothetical protein
MADYRAYTVGYDRHFTDFKAIICHGDREAIEQAKTLLDDHTIELWSGDRMVTRLRHAPE